MTDPSGATEEPGTDGGRDRPPPVAAGPTGPKRRGYWGAPVSPGFRVRRSTVLLTVAFAVTGVLAVLFPSTAPAKGGTVTAVPNGYQLVPVPTTTTTTTAPQTPPVATTTTTTSTTARPPASSTSVPTTTTPPRPPSTSTSTSTTSTTSTTTSTVGGSQSTTTVPGN